MESKLKVLMFTDLVNSSAFKAPDKLGDGHYVELVARPHVRLFRDLLSEYEGAKEVDYTGDGFFATFERASDAALFALQFQSAMVNRDWGGVPWRPQVRIGIHLGEVTVFQPGDGEEPLLASHAADMCARLSGLAAGQQILLSRAAFDNARQYLRNEDPSSPVQPVALRWLAHGRYLFKGREESMEVFEVGQDGVAPLRKPGDSEKARRSVSAEEEATLGWRPAPGLEVPGRPGWIVDRKLGDGGFGEVWLSRHQRTAEERVFKFCFDADRVQSFKREMTFFRLLREGLGEREDIVRLLDVRLDLPPFFVESEYIPTGDLGGWIEERGGLENVPMEERLRILAQVARTVSAAHSLGIIHKDIKPSNIFIRKRSDGAVQPILADFGIGVFADSSSAELRNIPLTGFTVTLVANNESSRTHTRLYAPPEAMLKRPPTTAWDLYSLGVMLYQFVVGDLTRPLGEGWREEVQDPLLQADIACCVLRDQEKRLANANALADLLESLEKRRSALLLQEQTEASRKRVERLRLQLAVAGAFLVISLGLGAMSWVGWTRASLRQKEAETARSNASAQRDLALNAIRKLIYEAQNALGKSPANHKARMKLLALAREQLEAIEAKAGGSQDQLSELSAATQSQLGDIWSAAGDSERSRQAYERAMETLGALRKEQPQNEQIAANLSVVLSRLGDMALGRGDLTNATRFYSADHELSQQLAARSTNDHHQLNLSSSHVKMGTLAQARKDSTNAWIQFESALRMAQSTAARHPGKFTPLHSIAIACQHLSDMAVAGGDHAQAVHYLQLGIGSLEDLHRLEPDNAENKRNLVVLLGKLGRVHRSKGDFAAAQPPLERSLQLSRDISNADPDNPQLSRDLSISLKELGDVAVGKRDAGAARAAYSESLAIREALAQSQPANLDRQRDLAVILRAVAELDQKTGRIPDAIQTYVRICRIHEQLFKGASAKPAEAGLELARSLATLGNLQRTVGDLKSARADLTRSIEIATPLASAPDADPEISILLSGVLSLKSTLEMSEGRRDAAIQQVRTALDLLNRLAESNRLPRDEEPWRQQIAGELRRLEKLSDGDLRKDSKP